MQRLPIHQVAHALTITLGILYCVTVHDPPASLLLVALLLSITFPLKLFLPFLLLIDLLLKIFTNLGSGFIVMNITKFEIGEAELLYIGLHISAWTMVASKNRLRIGRPKWANGLGATCLPILLYILCVSKLTHQNMQDWLDSLELGRESLLNEIGHAEMFQRVTLAVLTATTLLTTRPIAIRLVNLVFVGLILRDYTEVGVTLYTLSQPVILCLKAGIFLIFKAMSLHEEAEEGGASSVNPIVSRMSVRMSKLTPMIARGRGRSVNASAVYPMLLQMATIGTLVVTNGLGNVIGILGVYINLPRHTDKSFRLLVGTGMTVSLMLQPDQYIYFLYLFAVQYIPSEDYLFTPNSRWYLIELSRLYIMMSKVSLLNFLLAFTKLPICVCAALIIRTICSYFRIVFVFLGTEELYQDRLVPPHLFTDFSLYVFLILLRLYSENQRHLFAGTCITDIFAEYPWISRASPVLKVLKVVSLGAYLTISLMVLSTDPTIFSLVRILALLIVLTADLLNRNTARWWGLNFTISVAIAFTKYFYCLSTYQHISPLWLNQTLIYLATHSRIIGLDQYPLPIAILPDILLITLITIVSYTKQVQEHFLLRMPRDLPQMPHCPSECTLEHLYLQYIRAATVGLKHGSRLKEVGADLLLDAYFLLFILLNREPSSVNGVVHYLLMLIGFLQKNRIVRVLKWSLFYSCLDICVLYASQVHLVVVNRGDERDEKALLRKYFTLLLCWVFYEMGKSIECYYSRTGQATGMAQAACNAQAASIEECPKCNREYRGQSLWVVPAFVGSTVRGAMRRQVVALWINLWKVSALAMYLAQIGSSQGWTLVCRSLAAVVIVLLMEKNPDQALWSKSILVIGLLDMWSGCLAGYFYLLSSRLYHFFILDQSLPILEQKEQEQWQYFHHYITTVWLLPLLSILSVLLGLTMLDGGVLPLATCLIALAALIIHLLARASQPLLSVRICMASSIALGLSLVYHTQSPAFSSVVGIYFVILGIHLFLELCRCSMTGHLLSFVYHRCLQAKQYWEEKGELVSELGSQIHNEKKLLSLQEYFLGREAVQDKVKALTRELRSKRGYEAEPVEAEPVEIEGEVSKDIHFEVYSNMLTFMSVDDLQFCCTRLNHYYKGRVGVKINVGQRMRQVREWVRTHFQTDFRTTLALYHKQEGMEQDKRQSMGQDRGQVLEQVGQGQMSKSAGSNWRYRKQAQQLSSSCSQRIDLRLNELPMLVRKCIQNIQIIGLIVVAGWNFFGGVYTIPANIAIFAWALVLETKTTIRFWTFLLGYSGLIFAFKLALPLLPAHPFLAFWFYYHPADYFYQYFILVVCSIEIVVLQWGGTHSIVYSQRENIYDAFLRTAMNQASNGIHHIDSYDFLQVYSKLSVTNHSFFHRVFAKNRLKPGKDFYPLLTIIQLFILLYIFFFYDMMEFESKNNRKSLGELFSVTQFSRNMIVMLFFQVLIMIADRLIVSLNIVDPSHQQLENYLLNFVFGDHPKYPPPASSVSSFDALLIIKYLFHTCLLICVNFFVYFYIPSGSLQKSLIPECQNAVCGKSYTYLSVFLLLYLAYFVVSGLQIKHGFNRNKCRNTLMESFHWAHYYIYMFFTGLPFLWEFKKICDWTTTATALPLFHWMKFEDINARLYQSKCQTEILKLKPKNRPPWNKFILGPPGFLLILGIVLSPLVIYSPLNPFAVKDSIIAATIRLSLMRDNIQYKFFQTSHTSQISPHQHQRIGETSLIRMSSSPDEDFLLSQPTVLRLSRQLSRRDGRFGLVLAVTITQKVGGQSRIEWGRKLLDDYELDQLSQLINYEADQLEIAQFYSPSPGWLPKQKIVLRASKERTYFQLQSESEGVQFYYKSEVKYKVGMGLLTFYLTYVLLMHSLLRFYLNGKLENVIYEGCNLERILVLCDAVRSARIIENFYEEEYLYFSLVDLTRQPRAIKQMAGEFLKLRQNATF